MSCFNNFKAFSQIYTAGRYKRKTLEMCPFRITIFCSPDTKLHGSLFFIYSIINIFLQISSGHPLQHRLVLDLLKSLFERNYPQLDTLVEVT